MGVKTRVSKGITAQQVEELIDLTGRDIDVQKYTRDSERFKNEDLFQKWKIGKTIYTLSDSKNSLLGIIWFEKKVLPEAKEVHFTFAIRVYPPARGKGFAKNFMEEAFSDFGKSGIWLSTKEDNTKAVNLYKSFGFKILKVKDDRIIMTLTS
jgi:ribosomal protein S18 acetylase RimI-like enzyme